jgi:nitronate monooxygenase
VAAGVDALVAQGTDAGGHTGSVGTLPLLQLVLEIGDAAGLPVLAAGGIATGRGIAGVLAMGAAGAWIGTRFAATAEALGADRAKQAILQADERHTVHTHVFDIVQGLPWPDEFPGRALQNAFTERWHGREDALRAQLSEARRSFEVARRREDYSELHVYAGQAVGLVHELPPAGELVQRLVEEAAATIARCTRWT